MRPISIRALSPGSAGGEGWVRGCFSMTVALCRFVASPPHLLSSPPAQPEERRSDRRVLRTRHRHFTGAAA